MKYYKIGLILLLVIIAAVNTISAEPAKQRCFEDVQLDASEADLVKIVKNTISEKQQQFDQNCIDLLIERGFYKAAATLFEEYFVINGISLSDSTMRVAGGKKRDLEKFMASIWSANQAVQTIEPIVRWAQSKNHIFLHVKLSMRQDSPACIHCKIEKVEITNSTLLTSSYGIQSHQPLRFILNLTLFEEIDAEKSTWKEDSVGTLFFNLTKAIKPSNLEINNLPSLNEQSKEEPITNSENKQETQADTNGNKEVIATNEGTKEELKKETIPVQEEPQEGKLWLRLEKQERKKEFKIWWDMKGRYREDMDEWEKMDAEDREQKKKKAKLNQKEDL